MIMENRFMNCVRISRSSVVREDDGMIAVDESDVGHV